MAILTQKEINRKTEEYLYEISECIEEIEYNNEDIEEFYFQKRDFIYYANKDAITPFQLKCSIFEIDLEVIELEYDTAQNEHSIATYKARLEELKIYKNLLLTKVTPDQIDAYMEQLFEIQKTFNDIDKKYNNKVKEFVKRDKEHLTRQNLLEEEENVIIEMYCKLNPNLLDNVSNLNDEKYKHLIKPYILVEKATEKAIPKKIKQKQKVLAKVIQFKSIQQEKEEQ